MACLINNMKALVMGDACAVVYKNFKQGDLSQSDLLNIPSHLSGHEHLKKALPIFNETKSCARTVYRVCKMKIICGIFVSALLGLCLSVLRPLAVKYTIDEVQKNEPQLFILMLSVVGTILTEGFVYCHSNEYLANKCWVDIQSIVSALILRKIMTVDVERAQREAVAERLEMSSKETKKGGALTQEATNVLKKEGENRKQGGDKCDGENTENQREGKHQRPGNHDALNQKSTALKGMTAAMKRTTSRSLPGFRQGVQTGVNGTTGQLAGSGNGQNPTPTNNNNSSERRTLLSVVPDEASLISLDVLGKPNIVGFPLGLFPANVVGLIAGASYLMVVMGIAGLLAVIFICIFMGFSIRTLKKSKSFEAAALGAASKRLKILGEVLSNIRGVKYSCWEEKYFQRLRAARAEETQLFEQMHRMKVFGSNLGRCMPVISCVFTFLVYVLLEGTDQLTVELVFPVVTIFQGMRMSMVLIPVNWTNILAVNASLKRLDAYLLLPEIDIKNRLVDVDSEDGKGLNVVEIKKKNGNQNVDNFVTKTKEILAPDSVYSTKNLTVKFHVQKEEGKKENVGRGSKCTAENTLKSKNHDDLDDPPNSDKKHDLHSSGTLTANNKNCVTALRNISFENLKGFTAVTGMVGDGKTTLLVSLLGEQITEFGPNVYHHSKLSVGYCPQSAFVISGTLEDNVRMGRTWLTLNQIKTALKRSCLIYHTKLFDDPDVDGSRPNSAGKPSPVDVTKPGETTTPKSAGATPADTTAADTIATTAAPLEVDDLLLVDLRLETDIGEGGVTLSGGQQQRLNLARAWASEPDILVCDDPLSAVDGATAEHIFRAMREYTLNNSNTGKNKSIVIAMNQLGFLPFTDRILKLERGKLISDRRTGLHLNLEENIDLKDFLDGKTTTKMDKTGATETSKNTTLEKTSDLSKITTLHGMKIEKLDDHARELRSMFTDAVKQQAASLEDSDSFSQSQRELTDVILVDDLVDNGRAGNNALNSGVPITGTAEEMHEGTILNGDITIDEKIAEDEEQTIDDRSPLRTADMPISKDATTEGLHASDIDDTDEVYKDASRVSDACRLSLEIHDTFSRERLENEESLEAGGSPEFDPDGDRIICCDTGRILDSEQVPSSGNPSNRKVLYRQSSMPDYMNANFEESLMTQLSHANSNVNACGSAFCGDLSTRIAGISGTFPELSREISRGLFREISDEFSRDLDGCDYTKNGSKNIGFFGWFRRSSEGMHASEMDEEAVAKEETAKGEQKTGDKNPERKPAGKYSQKFLKEEEKKKGAAKFAFKYLAMYGNWNIFLITIFFFCAYIGLGVTEYSLAEWVTSARNDKLRREFEAAVTGNPIDKGAISFDDEAKRYVGFTGLFLLGSTVTGVVFLRGAMSAGRKLHDVAVCRVLGAPLSYFDESNTGKITGPFSTDLNGVDGQFSTLAEVLIQFVGVFITVLILQAMIVPLNTIFIVLCGIVYVGINRVIAYSVRDSKRLASLALSPVLANVTESVAGRKLARAMNLQSFFMDKHSRLLDQYLKGWYSSQRILVFSNLLFYGLASIISMFLVIFIYITREDIEPALIGLCVAYCFVIPFFSNLISQFIFVTSLGMMQCERVYSLRASIQEEKVEIYRKVREQALFSGGKEQYKSGAVNGPPDTKSDPNLLSFTDGYPLANDISMNPSTGVMQLLPPIGDGTVSEESKIIFKTCDMRYASTFPLAVRDFNLEIERGSHVGICGPTGAGKSSITAMLYRFVELERGSITINNVDISKIPLYQLRRNLSMVPQKPFLMHGTVRQNLDPFQEFEEKDLNKAFQAVFGSDVDPSSQSPEMGRVPSRGGLERPATSSRSGSRDAASKKSDSHDVTLQRTKSGTSGMERTLTNNSASSYGNRLTLDSIIEGGGKNISSGEAQLIAFSRMLLRKHETQIVLMDEPSSNLDSNTDSKITKLLKTELKLHTIFLIAHRLDTIWESCDKVLVMENGRVAEFGTPQDLVKNPNSFFAINMGKTKISQ